MRVPHLGTVLCRVTQGEEFSLEVENSVSIPQREIESEFLYYPRLLAIIPQTSLATSTDVCGASDYAIRDDL